MRTRWREAGRDGPGVVGSPQRSASLSGLEKPVFQALITKWDTRLP